jgi:NAD(P)-dependent dehydrogenase (short-subunit alcohol dehydrogenase family)
MASVWSYEGKRVLVTGGGGAGMGAAAVRDLVELGAEVHVFDLKEPAVDVASFRTVDLRDPAAMAEAVAAWGDHPRPVQLRRPPRAPVLGARHHARELRGRPPHDRPRGPLMPEGSAVVTISSAGAFGWENSLDQVAELIATPGYQEAKTWCEEHPQQVGEGYLLSKQAIIVWTLHAALDLAPRGIRVNSTAPGPTATPMMPSFENAMGKDFMDKFPKPLWGRNSTPEEQGHVVVFLNSDAANYITGTNIYADGGFSAGMLTSGSTSRSSWARRRPAERRSG